MPYYCKRTQVYEAYQWGVGSRPDWFEDAIKAKTITWISAKQGTVMGAHCGFGQWVVQRGKKLDVWGDEYFRRHFVRVTLEN